ncbi:MAG: CotH kinase family protein [Bacteroidales bacterium]|nr:MAG: CotH kinase family protein [Bacteroidales bacterium]
MSIHPANLISIIVLSFMHLSKYRVWLQVFLTYISLGIFPHALQAQGSNPVFADDIIPVVNIVIHPDSLNMILDPANAESDHEFPAVFIYNSGTVTDTIEDVGFRLRGNTSRSAAKKSFKVSFNTFERGRKYYGLEKLNLNGEHNDPSIIRSKLCWDIFKSMQVPGTRANHVRLYINDDYYGLYINVEHIDENFVDDRFGNNDGNLYKCLWPADLDYLGSDPELYKFTVGVRRTYDLKTNNNLDDYSDLADLIAFLNFTPEPDFTDLEKIFNVDGFLRILAVDVATGSWDDYWYLKNNYYLYHNPATDLFEFIPYDFDNTFGIDWFGKDWGNRDIYNWGHESEVRPLVTRILAVQEYRDRYSYYLNKLLNNSCHPDSIFPKIDAVHAMITGAAEQDPFRALDYGYSFDDFNNSYEQALYGHVKYGIKPFITTRRNSALAQLQLNDILPIIKDVSYIPQVAQTDQAINVTVYIEDEDPAPAVQINHSINGSDRTPVSMFDDGLHHDGLAGDLIYGGQIPAANADGNIQFYISATDENSNQSFIPRNVPDEQFSVPVGIEIPKLFINEFMASNNLTVSDDVGEFDDWIEIYNSTDEPVNIGGFYITDDLDNPYKYYIPEYASDYTTIPANGFIVLWADGQVEQGILHMNFRLDMNGEQIGLAQVIENNAVFIDSLTYGGQKNNVSYGRYTDGTDNWNEFYFPTPGYSNVMTDIQKSGYLTGDFALYQNYPNPFSSRTVISYWLPVMSDVELSVYSLPGQKVTTLVKEKQQPGSYEAEWNASGMKPGIYWCELKTRQGREVIKMVLLRE